jgi:hypothetical protein
MPTLSDAELCIVAEVVTELAKYRGTSFDKAADVGVRCARLLGRNAPPCSAAVIGYCRQSWLPPTHGIQQLSFRDGSFRRARVAPARQVYPISYIRNRELRCAVNVAIEQRMQPASINLR